MTKVDRASQERSELMRRVRQRDTAPELALRRLLHSAGYRFRTNVEGLPGTPDLVISARVTALFVHGCFWHGHRGCKLAKLPRTRTEFWDTKIGANRLRDARKEAELVQLGWRVAVVWQCELRDSDKLLERLRAELGTTKWRSSVD